MYSDKMRQEALDLWFATFGEMSLSQFVEELGYPSRACLENWIKEDPRHDPDKACYKSKPILTKLEAIKRVSEGQHCSQVARDLNMDVGMVKRSVDQFAAGGTAALLPKTRKKKEAPVAQKRKLDPYEIPLDIPEVLPDDPQELKKIINDLQLDNAILREVLDVLKVAQAIEDKPVANKVKTEVVARLEKDFGAQKTCTRMGLARSSYYYHYERLTDPAIENSTLKTDVEQAFRVDGQSARGYRFVYSRLAQKYGNPVSEKRIRHIMRELSLVVCYKKKNKRYSSYAGEIDAPAPNLLLEDNGKHNFRASAPNEVWVSDITEFKLPDDSRKVYLSPVIDLFDGKPVGWSIGTSPDADLANTSLLKALSSLPKDKHPILHTDRGSHYRWDGWKQICVDAGITRSMSRKGHSPDNAACEGFFGRLKNEKFYGRDWRGWSAEEFMRVLDSWLERYSTVRLKGFKEDGKLVYDTIDSRRARLGLVA